MILTYAFIAKTVTKLIAGAILVLDTFATYAAHFKIIGVAIMARFTLTERLAIYHFAACIVATHSRSTRINTFQYSLFGQLACLVSLA